MTSSRPYRLYISSYFLTQVGGWLNFIAILSLLRDINTSEDGESTETVPIAVLLVLRNLPALFVSPAIGGPIADKFDKRVVMICCDILSTIIVGFGFPFAAHSESTALLYVFVFFQAVVDAIYQPAKSAIVPFMLETPEQITKATSLLTISWSVTSAIGAATGGFITEWGGVTTCFVMDSITFAISALLIYLVGDSWKLRVPKSADKSTPSSSSENVWTQLRGGFTYLRTTGSNISPIVFFKSLGCILWGFADLMNVVFTEGNSLWMGFVFASVGVGCFIGPVLCDRHLVSKDGSVPPATLVRSCVGGLILVPLGFFGMSFSQGSLLLLSVWTLIRSAGSAILWTYSSVLLSTLVDESVLGRVNSIEYASAIFIEGASGMAAAILIDEVGMNVYSVSRLISIVGIFISVSPAYIYYLRCWRKEDGGGYLKVSSDEIEMN